MFKRIFIILILIFGGILSAQTKQSKDERAISDVLRSIQLDFESSIIEGSRVFVMTPKISIGVSPYLRDRLKDGLTNALGDSKFQLVYQPFLEDNTAKKIEVSDTVVRVQQFSTMNEDYNSMRAVIDTLNAYSVDLFVASRIQKTQDDHLIVHVQFVKTKNLEVLSNSSYFSNKSARNTTKNKGLYIDVFTGQNKSSLAYRDYTNLSNGIVGPYNVVSQINGVTTVFYQDVARTVSSFKGGLLLGAENSFVREGFIDTLYQSHTFSIPSFLVGLSIRANLNSSGPKGKPVLGIEERIFLGKPTMIDQYLVSETRVNIGITEFLNLFGSVRYSQPVAFSSSVQQILEFQSYSLCYGISVNI